MENYRYDAFISYRHVPHDKAVAKKLHTLLETYQIPGPIAKAVGKKKLTRIFRDEEELPIAASLNESLTTALQQSEWLIVIASPDWRASTWCNAEVDEFIKMGRRDHILVVLASGTPETSIPLQLLSIETEEGVKAMEPLCANLIAPTTAESVKKLNVEKLRILAPMLGVNFDDLKQRARQRKIKTIAIIAAAAVVAVAGLLTFVLINNQKQAELRLQAEKERIQKGMASIGELLANAKNEAQKENKLTAMNLCLEALEISDSIDGAEHEKIVDALRNYSYAEPFSKIADFDNQNVRMTDMVAGPDGRTMAGIINGNAIAIVDVLAGTTLTTIPTETSQILDLMFSPDGSRIAALCDKGRMAICWNVADGTECARYTSKQNQEYHVANVRFLEEDVLLVQDMAELFRLPIGGEPQLIYTIGQYNGAYNRNYNFFTRSFGQIDERLTFYSDDYTGVSLVVSEDRQTILVSDSKGNACVTVIDPQGKLICALTDIPGLFTEKYYLSRTGKYAACTSYAGYFAAWDLTKKQLLYAYNMGEDATKGSPGNIVFSSDEETMAFAWTNLFVMNTSDAKIKFYCEIEETNLVPKLAFSSDDAYLLLENQDLEVYRATDGSMVTRMPLDDDVHYSAALLTSDMSRLLTARSDGRAEIFCTIEDATSKEAVTISTPYESKAERNKYNSPAFNVTGQHEVSQGFKESTAVTDFTPVVASSQDGAWVAMGYADGAIEIFHKEFGASPKYTLWELQIKPYCIRFCGTTLIASDMNGQVLTFDLLENKVLTKFKPDYVVDDIAVSGDGQYLLLLSSFTNATFIYPMDGTEQLFYMRTHSLTADGGFTTDGKSVVAKDIDGSYVVGNLLTDETELIQRAKDLTKDME